MHGCLTCCRERWQAAWLEQTVTAVSPFSPPLKHNYFTYCREKRPWDTAPGCLMGTPCDSCQNIDPLPLPTPEHNRLTCCREKRLWDTAPGCVTGTHCDRSPKNTDTTPQPLKHNCLTGCREKRETLSHSARLCNGHMLLQLQKRWHPPNPNPLKMHSCLTCCREKRPWDTAPGCIMGTCCDSSQNTDTLYPHPPPHPKTQPPYLLQREETLRHSARLRDGHTLWQLPQQQRHLFDAAPATHHQVFRHQRHCLATLLHLRHQPKVKLQSWAWNPRGDGLARTGKNRHSYARSRSYTHMCIDTDM